MPTIVSLLLRLYEVGTGTILIDGVDLREWDLRSLRRQMSLAMQEPTLFNYYNILEKFL
jgi:ABC-type multidrug transport system fused ATPase/permease subunit